MRPLPTSLTALADQCVMCGLCLPHCPTFRLAGTESHSPRGRVTLARALDQQPALAMDASYREALESCLQCRACERVCPAHVEFGEIIEGARALLAAVEKPSTTMRLLSWAAAHPGVSAGAIGFVGAVARALPLPGRAAAQVRRAQQPLSLSTSQPAPLALFVGCVARAFERAAQADVLDVARRIGVDFHAISDQGCCGALDRHLGLTEAAELLATHNRSRFAAAGVRTLLALDSGCIDALRRSLADVPDAPQVLEVCRWLMQHLAEWQPLMEPRRQRIGLFLPCSHRNVVGDVAAVRAVLAAMPDVQVVDVPTGFGCCGAAGPHLLAHASTADAFAAPIVAALLGMQLDAVVTTNVGCALHLRERLAAAGSVLSVRHPVSLVAERIGAMESAVRVPPYESDFRAVESAR